LLDQRESAWQEMVSKIQDEVPAYTLFASPDEEAGWAEGVLRLFGLFLELAAQDRWLTADEAHAIRDTGATRFDQGFGDNDVRASVRIAIGVARTRIISEYSPAGAEDKEAMDRVLALLDRYGNEVEDLLVAGWEARRDELATGSPALVQLIVDLADGLLTDSEFARRMEAVGLDPTAGQCLILLPYTQAGADAVAQLKDDQKARVVLHRSSAETPHRLLMIPVQHARDRSALLRAVEAAAARPKTTALVVGPCHGPAECEDRYAEAVVLVPYAAALAEGRAVLEADTGEFTLCSVVASLSPAARQWLLRDVLRGADKDPKLVNFLRESIESEFVLNEIARRTGWDIRTVYARRDRLEKTTKRRYADAADQTALILAHCVIRLGA
jgi:hypothetical protein